MDKYKQGTFIRTWKCVENLIKAIKCIIHDSFDLSKTDGPNGIEAGNLSSR